MVFSQKTFLFSLGFFFTCWLHNTHTHTHTFEGSYAPLKTISTVQQKTNFHFSLEFSICLANLLQKQKTKKKFNQDFWTTKKTNDSLKAIKFLCLFKLILFDKYVCACYLNPFLWPSLNNVEQQTVLAYRLVCSFFRSWINNDTVIRYYREEKKIQSFVGFFPYQFLSIADTDARLYTCNTHTNTKVLVIFGVS